ncbi:MAG: hypothetical protein LBN30_08905 [Oscillospiraceae bacterium]|nr:hypothetical protein [Oscillospiraceae bacterium]
MDKELAENQIDLQDNAFLVATEGSAREETVEQAAENETRTIFGDYIGELYVERYFSKEAKSDVTEMVRLFIMVEINKAKFVPLASKQGKPVERAGWDDTLPVFAVNAGYTPAINGIIFPAGIFQGLFYDDNAPKEKNLGAIGMIIAHEISHAFDDNRAKYDENGNVRDWWTAEDYTKFQELCQGVISLFDGKKFVPGLVGNGTHTLGENIADMGGPSCALAVAESMIPNVDYKLFFDSNAAMWQASRCSRARMEYILSADVHSPAVLRANINFQNIDKFYEVYGIIEGDGMYLAPEKRIKIW